MAFDGSNSHRRIPEVYRRQFKQFGKIPVARERSQRREVIGINQTHHIAIDIDVGRTGDVALIASSVAVIGGIVASERHLIARCDVDGIAKGDRPVACTAGDTGSICRP